MGKRMSLLFLLSPLCIVPLAMADELNVAPKACATSSEALPCRFSISVHYQTDTEQNLCLWLKHEAEPRRCYTGLKELSEELSLALEKDATIEIRDMNSRVLLSTQVSVVLFQPPQKRKRRGLNWDLL